MTASATFNVNWIMRRAFRRALAGMSAQYNESRRMLSSRFTVTLNGDDVKRQVRELERYES